MRTSLLSATLALCSSVPQAPSGELDASARTAREDSAAPAASPDASAAEEEEDEPDALQRAVDGLAFRALGPALNSGRVGDFAVDPTNPARYFVAAASGGIWKTTNAGTTWTPVFDGEGSYSIGCLRLDPQNPHVIWAGTGENNSQRSVSFGDGVYKSTDGGQSWTNTGLERSEHIGMIQIDPRDSDVVWVAAQGPLWASGGDRGLYRTVDGGATWERKLHVSDDTGINEVHLDPRDPDVMWASAYQRRRRVWTLLNGGPESGIHKSTDGGETWREVRSGLPKVDLGRIGLAVSPADPDVLFAIVEAARGEGGFYRSTDRGETWHKRNDFMTSSPQYYNEVVCDPRDADRVYLLDTYLRVSEDGGATIQRVPIEDKHVDDHALWIDPADTDHLRVGSDGGVYETWDRGAAWRFVANLPLTQFYRVAVDDAHPFYNVYGGTQDNNTIGGPSRTTHAAGIANEDWFITVGGDGFEPAVDPTDPNIVYSQWQYGNLVRYDRRTGERFDIKPREAIGEPELRWNWDAPLVLSPHDPRRLYFAANVLFRSDDRGDSWRAVSGDLSRGIDRDQLEVMGRVWEADAVAKNDSTSQYGNAVALCESPLVEGLLYVGTDDGLVWASPDGGETWERYEAFPDVPDRAYVSDLEASRHDADTVYATFDAHKDGDFAPYVLRSTDRGRSWTSLVANLEAPAFCYALAEDHVDPELLFLGTEFGVRVSLDGGARWLELSKGLPTIAIRDLELQRRWNDLVLASFGRGFFVLDDYAPLRALEPELLERDAHLFAVPDALAYVQTSRFSHGRGSQGASYFTADNPPFGAVFTYWLREDLQSLRERRHAAEEEAREAGSAAPYPTFEALAAEEQEPEPYIELIVRAEDGAIVRRVRGARNAGLHRVAWDLRFPAAVPVHAAGDDASGPLATPGTYSVSLARVVAGETLELGEPRAFAVRPLARSGGAAVAAHADAPAEQAARPDAPATLAFEREVGRLQRAVLAAGAVLADLRTRLDAIDGALRTTPELGPEDRAAWHALRERAAALEVRLAGDRTRRDRNAPAAVAIRERVERVVRNRYASTLPPSATERQAYTDAADRFAPFLEELRVLVQEDLAALEARLEAAGAPHTPGRFPRWSRP